MLPVCDAGEENLVEVAEHRLEALRLLGRRLRETSPDLPRPYRREHRQVPDALQVVGRPVHRAVPVLPERHFLTFDQGRVLTI